MDNPDPTEPWDRRRQETPRSFGAFCQYRDLGPNRSMRKVLNLEDAPTNTFRTLQEWSSVHDWVDRAAAWDEYVDREFRAEQVTRIKAMRENHARIARMMLAKAAVAVDGIDPEKLSPRDAVSLIRLATDVERKALGEPDLVVQTEDVTTPVSSRQIWDLLRRNPDLVDLVDELESVLDSEEV